MAVQQPHLPYVPPAIFDLQFFDIAELVFFTNDINPANVQEARMILPQGTSYPCSACTMVMVHDQTTRDGHDNFCYKSSVFIKFWWHFTRGKDGRINWWMFCLTTKNVQVPIACSWNLTKVENARYSMQDILTSWHTMTATDVSSNHQISQWKCA